MYLVSWSTTCSVHSTNLSTVCQYNLLCSVGTFRTMELVRCLVASIYCFSVRELLPVSVVLIIMNWSYSSREVLNTHIMFSIGKPISRWHLVHNNYQGQYFTISCPPGLCLQSYHMVYEVVCVLEISVVCNSLDIFHVAYNIFITWIISCNDNMVCLLLFLQKARIH